MIPIAIQPKTEGKGRSFPAHLLAYMTADALWSGGDASSSDIRPVWAVVGGSDQEMRPFLANWTRGRKAETLGYHPERYELLKSAGYQVAHQRFAEGTTATLCLPDLFRSDPGMVDPKWVRFGMLPGRAWADAQVIADRARIVAYVETLDESDYRPPTAEGALDRLVPHAFLFAVYLDRRTRCPLVADGRFYLQLMLGFLRREIAHAPGRGAYSRKAMGLSDVGIAEEGALVLGASQEDVETIIADEVEVYFQKTRGRA